MPATTQRVHAALRAIQTPRVAGEGHVGAASSEVFRDEGKLEEAAHIARNPDTQSSRPASNAISAQPH